MIFGIRIEVNRFRKLVLAINTLTKTRWISCLLWFGLIYPFIIKLLLREAINASLLCIFFVFLFGYPIGFSWSYLSPWIDFTRSFNGSFGSLVSSLHDTTVMGTVQVGHSWFLDFPCAHLRDKFFKLFSKRRSPVNVLCEWRLS